METPSILFKYYFDLYNFEHQNKKYCVKSKKVSWSVSVKAPNVGATVYGANDFS